MSSVKKINCIMLVNDPVEIEIFQMALDEMGLLVHCDFYTDCKELIRVLKKKEPFPDCIIIDSDLGNLGRKDCLKKIKNVDAVSKVPLVIFSGILSETEIASLKKLGTYGFISKANSVNELKTNLIDFFNTNFNNTADMAI